MGESSHRPRRTDHRPVDPSTRRPFKAAAVPQRELKPDQRLREHLEDALAEADGLGWTVVAALVSAALDALGSPSSTGLR